MSFVVCEYPCTECKGDAYIAYIAKEPGDWNGLVKVGERLCTRCLQKRGGLNFFARANGGNS